MKYSELISFNPIEDVIELTKADSRDIAREYVKTYVMSDRMAEDLQAPVIDQLKLDESYNKKGVFVIGNFGTGKSHLMSVISSIAYDADNLQYLNNKKFAESIKSIAGKFEVLRIEIGSMDKPLSEIIFHYIDTDFKKMGISYDKQDLDQTISNKERIQKLMLAFLEKYPDKGYLIVVDEFLSYLITRSEEYKIVNDLEFLRELGELCSTSNLRIILGVQEKIFDHNKLKFFFDKMKRVSDRFTQIIITKEATSYVVSERILKKTPEQKALIRAHLEKYANLYTGMSSRLEEFVDLYPIHPAYIDVLNNIPVIETRHILKNISLAIKNIFDTDVPENATGIISFDDYWSAIKSDGFNRTNEFIRPVLDASGQLEEIIRRSFPTKHDMPIAIKIIYALSVHRLSTKDLNLKIGLTAENLKDDLCLYQDNMPEKTANFLLGLVTVALRKITVTVSGQFIMHNEENDQYYIDVYKVVDYDEKIKQHASIIGDEKLNRYFYDLIYKCLNWNKDRYVHGFEIYEYDLNWESHNIFREGYLFMGLPKERSTAQPKRDFYIHIMPPYGNADPAADLDDEVYLYFKSTDEFKDNLLLYSGANSIADISDGRDKEIYRGKADQYLKKLIKYLNEYKNTCFDVVYKKDRRQLIEVLKGRHTKDYSFYETIDIAASYCLDGYLNKIYPDFPIMQTKITHKNIDDNVRVAFDHFAGRKSQLSNQMLKSFGVLDDDKIRPKDSKYAAYYIDLVQKLPQQGVLNHSDLFEKPEERKYGYVDKKFHIWHTLMPIVFLSMVYAGKCVITLKNGEKINASTLDRVPKIGISELSEFKYISKPEKIQIAELKRLFEVMDLNPALLDNPYEQDKGVEDLLRKAQKLCEDAVKNEHKLTENFNLWGEDLINPQLMQKTRKACDSVKEEFSNYGSRFNTYGKLDNFKLTDNEIDELGKSIKLLKLIPEYVTFKTECYDIVKYISDIENLELGASMKSDIEKGKDDFRKIRDSIFEGTSGEVAARKVSAELEKIKEKYINIYFEAHKKKRLGIDDAKRKGKIQESLALSNLHKLSGIDILSGAKLTDIDKDLASLLVCYELTPEELKTNPSCKHCKFIIDEKTKNVFGQLDNIEDRIDDLVIEWTKTLIDTLSDPLVLKQREFLSAKQIEVIDSFIESRKLPERVDEFFVNSIMALLKNYETAIIDAEDLMQKLEELPPMDENSFKSKLNEIVSEYTKGKDTSTIRIVVKRKQIEE